MEPRKYAADSDVVDDTHDCGGICIVGIRDFRVDVRKEKMIELDNFFLKNIIVTTFFCCISFFFTIFANTIEVVHTDSKSYKNIINN